MEMSTGCDRRFLLRYSPFLGLARSFRMLEMDMDPSNSGNLKPRSSEGALVEDRTVSPLESRRFFVHPTDLRQEDGSLLFPLVYR